ncbi:MAG: dihydroneopterin aldolase family protein [Methanomassiliicoccales archaeon]|nr:MAG: dihydroneopterin aldolase family protein [Methanomassiliicoccales archaeon]
MDIADKYFNCTNSERAVFEAGIKLGTVYHQFVGAPISKDNVEVLEKSIAEGAKVQPFVVDAAVKIDRRRLREKSTDYDYLTLTGDMLDVALTVQYEDVTVICEMRHIPEMDYPLMYVKEIIRKDQ